MKRTISAFSDLATSSLPAAAQAAQAAGDLAHLHHALYERTTATGTWTSSQ